MFDEDTMTLAQFKKAKAEMLLEGWERHSNHIDATTISENLCPFCEGNHSHYEGFKRGKEYIAYAVCPDCNTVYLF